MKTKKQPARAKRRDPRLDAVIGSHVQLSKRLAALETEMARQLDLRRLIVAEHVAARGVQEAETRLANARHQVRLWLLKDETARRPNMTTTGAAPTRVFPTVTFLP